MYFNFVIFTREQLETPTVKKGIKIIDFIKICSFDFEILL